MLTAARRIARRRLDEKYVFTQSLRTLERPAKGWIKVIRDALGMTGAQFAKRLGIAWQSMDDLERSEAAGTIQLDKLRRAAEALDCTLVYAIIPNGSLEAMVEARARAIATAAIGRVDQTMALEDHRVTRDDNEHLIEDYIHQHIRDRDLWKVAVD